jgi:hypothetical protein
MMVGRRLIGIALIALMAVGSVVLWLGIPVVVIYGASRLVKSSQPTMGPYVLVLVGIPTLMVVVGKLLSKLNRVYADVMGSAQTDRVTLPWHRSMRGERDAGHRTTVLDVVMVCSVGLALLAFGAWFFLFAGSSLPT